VLDAHRLLSGLPAQPRQRLGLQREGTEQPPACAGYPRAIRIRLSASASVMAWLPLRKGVAFLSRYREICGQCNGRYLDALAHVDDPTPAIRALDALSARAATPDGRTVRPFNPVARQDRTLFEVLMSGEHVLHGFTNRELRDKLARASFPLAADPAKHSGQVTRLLRRLHVHQLIAKIPRSRRWRVSLNGRRVMAAAVKLREVAYPGFYAAAA
jgi:hypothetical protein